MADTNSTANDARVAATLAAAEQVAEAFRAGPAYVAFCESSQKLNESPEALDLLDRLQQMGADETELQLQGNVLLRNFFNAQQQMMQAAAELNAVISNEIGVDYASLARSGCCG